MSNATYSVAYRALRLQAKCHGVNPNSAEMNNFLKQTAEVISTDRDLINQYEKIINNPVRRK